MHRTTAHVYGTVSAYKNKPVKPETTEKPEEVEDIKEDIKEFTTEPQEKVLAPVVELGCDIHDKAELAEDAAKKEDFGVENIKEEVVQEIVENAGVKVEMTPIVDVDVETTAEVNQTVEVIDSKPANSTEKPKKGGRAKKA